jgi:GrpB-like predicted nucleotidyltransferase (UPF0157 family)
MLCPTRGDSGYPGARKNAKSAIASPNSAVISEIQHPVYWRERLEATAMLPHRWSRCVLEFRTAGYAIMSEPVVRIVIVEYDPRWPAFYEEERARIAAALGDMLTSVEHIGSTAVPRLSAKPLIDILVTVDHLGSPDRYVEPLRGLGYTFFPVLGNAGRYAFGTGIPHTHHIHVVQHGSEEHLLPLAFRDYLRTHPAAARQYEALKRDLAARFHDDRQAYNAAKTAFIRAIEASARG